MRIRRSNLPAFRALTTYMFSLHIQRGGGPMPIAAPPGFAIVPISTLSTMSQPALANTQPNLP